MAARFDQVKFNLMRAIEIFQDLNATDMDVTAPPSSRDYFKETEVANRLNDFLGQLIDEGVFDNCEPRDAYSSNEEEEEGSYTGEEGATTTPESGGFELRSSGTSGSGSRDGRESFTNRFKRYVQRILPTRRPTRSGSEESQGSRLTGYSTRNSSDGGGFVRRESRSRTRDSEQSAGSRRSHSRSLGSEPYDPSVVYEHRHRHKHNHPGSHHHHEHSGPHTHTYHSHTGSSETGSDANLTGQNDYDSHGLSGTYQMETDDDLSSGPLASRATTRSRSRSASSRRNASVGRKSSRSSRSSR